jgi:hypothetical protein
VGSGAAEERLLAALQQQRDDQIFFVIQVADQLASEIALSVAKAGEVAAERNALASLVRQYRVRPFHDAAERRMQRGVVALEQLEPGGKRGSARRNSGK